MSFSILRYVPQFQLWGEFLSWVNWRQEEKGTTEDEMAGWHHWLDGRESEWTPAVGDGQGGLACCDSWGCKELDTTEWLNWTELNWMSRTRTWVWVNSGSWWCTGRPGVLRFMGSQRVGQDWVTELNWTELSFYRPGLCSHIYPFLFTVHSMNFTLMGGTF